MAVIKTPILIRPAIAKSGSAETSAIECYRARVLTATVRLTFNASATAGAVLSVLTSPDKENWDTEAYGSGTITLSAGNTVQKTFIIDPPEEGQVKLKVTNSDTTYTVTGVKVWFTLNRFPSTGFKMTEEERSGEFQEA